MASAVIWGPFPLLSGGEATKGAGDWEVEGGRGFRGSCSTGVRFRDFDEAEVDDREELGRDTGRLLLFLPTGVVEVGRLPLRDTGGFAGVPEEVALGTSPLDLRALRL